MNKTLVEFRRLKQEGFRPMSLKTFNKYIENKHKKNKNK